MTATDADRATWRSQFERLGVESVRQQLAQGRYAGNPDLLNAAIDWVAHEDEEERSRNEASQAAQMRTALSAKNAAWVAAIAAIIAAIAAIITIVVELKK